MKKTLKVQKTGRKTAHLPRCDIVLSGMFSWFPKLLSVSPVKMAEPYISFHNLLKDRCLPLAVAWYLGVVGRAISVYVWGWCPRLYKGLLVSWEVFFFGLSAFILTCLTFIWGSGSLVLLGRGLWMACGVCLFHWRALSIGQKGFSGLLSF